MKVALLLFGQPRGIDKEDVWLSHKKFILDKYDTDVYCHLWYSPSQSNYEVSTHAGSTPTAVIQGSDSIIKIRYNPKEMCVEPPRLFDCETYIRAFESTGEFKCSANFPNYISQIYSVEQVAKLCMESNIQYDMIVMARYDLVIDLFPDLDELNPKFFYCMNTHPRFPDLFYIFSHKFLETQRVYTGLEERIRRHIPSGRIWEASAECMKFLKYLDVSDPTFIRGVEIREHRI